MGFVNLEMKVAQSSKPKAESKHDFFTARFAQGRQEGKEQRQGSYTFPVGHPDREKLKPFRSLAASAVQLLSL